MVYEIKFAEKGHAWYAYKGICNSYRGIGNTDALSAIKIKDSVITVPHEQARDKVLALAQKCKARGVTIDELV
jgi:hypothetical protein